jgi:hypothetical protein
MNDHDEDGAQRLIQCCACSPPPLRFLVLFKPFTALWSAKQHFIQGPCSFDFWSFGSPHGNYVSSIRHDSSAHLVSGTAAETRRRARPMVNAIFCPNAFARRASFEVVD